MKAARSVRWLWVAAAVVAFDRATKYAIESFTTEGYRNVLIPGFAAVVHSRNRGMAFGLLAGSGPGWFSVALVLIGSAVVLFLAWLLTAGHVTAPLTCAGMALLAGGAAGNLLDRVIHGAVTDFVELHVGSFYWPAFNVADAAITIGAALMLVELFWGDSRHAARQE
jgi:signal peptidase II